MEYKLIFKDEFQNIPEILYLSEILFTKKRMENLITVAHIGLQSLPHLLYVAKAINTFNLLTPMLRVTYRKSVDVTQTFMNNVRCI